MKNTIILEETARPRDKESYYTDEPLTFLLSDDFQSDIRDSVIATLKETNDTRFPLSGSSSIFIDCYSDRRISTIGVLKNVLDSLNRLLISDDKKVKSALIRKYPAKEDQESLHLSLMSTRDILSIDDSVDCYKPYILFSKEISTTLEDRYLPFPKDLLCKEVVEVNYHSDRKISSRLRDKYNGPIVEGNISLKIEITLTDDCGDLDNLALNYISNCRGIIYKEVDQIEKLLIIKRLSSTENPSIKISW